MGYLSCVLDVSQPRSWSTGADAFVYDFVFDAHVRVFHMGEEVQMNNISLAYIFIIGVLFYAIGHWIANEH